jgi:4-diphosphocytidyl-2-C-methyl-D-erythritol kinase
MVLSENSFAKINLFLNIVGKLENGYHLLESFFIPLKIFDTVTLVTLDKSDTDEIIMNGIFPLNIDMSENIVLKIADKLREKCGIKEKVKFTIDKNIPVAAGLGGGSSNAATALKLMCKIWKINLTEHEAMEIALSIGADVPFFLKAQPAFVEGIGGGIYPMAISKKLFLLIVNPGFPMNTREIFKMGFKNFSDRLEDKSSEALSELFFTGKNDLEYNAISKDRRVGKLLRYIKYQEGCLSSRISGSGPSCFGLFSNLQSLLKAKKFFEENNFWVYSEEI